MNKKSKIFLSLGFIGVFIILILNLVSLYYMEKNNAVFFSQEWNSIWLPNYIIWFSFLIIGIAFGFSNKKNH